MQPKISIIPSSEIDKSKWDVCIANANNSFIYGHSFYLDAMADHWDGLIIDNYTAVMPLPWRKKLGIRYCYTPAFTQQLGLFGDKDLVGEEILQTIKKHIRYGDLMLNHENGFIQLQETVRTCTNLVIDLSDGYEIIRTHYKKDLLDNLAKAAKEEFVFDTTRTIEAIIDLYQKLYRERTMHVKSSDYQNFTGLCFLLKEKGHCFTRSIKDINGRLLCAGLFLNDARRIYNIMNITTIDGRVTEANHLLIDSVIREFAGENLLFDFEGSDLPGVKSFYQKFGAVDQPYYHWHFNELPWVVKLVKK